MEELIDKSEKKETRKLTCIICPMGCLMEASVMGSMHDDGAGGAADFSNGSAATVVTTCLSDSVKIVVTGNSCKRGEEYAKKELTCPSRTLTCSVGVKGGKRPLVSAKTNGEIPKELLLPSMQFVRRLSVSAPIRSGDVIVKDFMQTGVDLVSCEEVARL